MLRAALFAGLTCALACGTPSPPPRSAPPVVATPPPIDAAVPDAAPLDQDLPRLVERSLAMYRDVAAALAATDCTAVAGQLAQLATTYRDVVQANAAVLHAGRAAQLRAALEPRGDDFDRSARAIMQSPTMAKCAQDAAFARAFDDLLQPP